MDLILEGLAILDALFRPDRHPTAEDLYVDVQRVSPTTGRATVYKTVDTLRALGELRELELGTGRAHYDAIDPTDHSHVVCTECGRVEDVRLDDATNVVERAGAASGFRIQAHRLEFFGQCPDCLARTSGNP